MARNLSDEMIREIVALKQKNQELVLHLHKPDKNGQAHWSAQLGHPGNWEFTDQGEDLQAALTNLLNALKESITP
jgi:hypothetical protein